MKSGKAASGLWLYPQPAPLVGQILEAPEQVYVLHTTDADVTFTATDEDGLQPSSAQRLVCHEDLAYVAVSLGACVVSSSVGSILLITSLNCGAGCGRLTAALVGGMSSRRDLLGAQRPTTYLTRESGSRGLSLSKLTGYCCECRCGELPICVLSWLRAGSTHPVS